jgi:hypothetical protein
LSKFHYANRLSDARTSKLAPCRAPVACSLDQQSAAVQRWQRWRSTPPMVYTHGQASSTHCRCVSTFPSIICDFHDSATSHHPLASSCINVDITRHPFAGSMPRILCTGQLARNFGTIHAICPSLTISTPPGTRNFECKKPHDPWPSRQCGVEA